MRLQRCREYRDAGALIELGIAEMVRLSQCGDPAVAMKASQMAGGVRRKRGEGQASGERGNRVYGFAIAGMLIRSFWVS